MTLTSPYSSLLVLSLTLLFACTPQKKENDFGIGKNRPKSIINNHLLFSTFDKEFSFPIWFDDSLIAVNEIQHITRNIFPASSDLKRIDSGRVVPAETFHYYFKKNGQVKKVVHQNYFDYKLIGESVYTYDETELSSGFAPTKKETNLTFSSLPKKKISGAGQLLYVPVKKRSDPKHEMLQFRNTSANLELFILPQKKHWGPFKIHKELAPTPKDFILIGTAYHPLKKYHVKNTVQEMNVQNFTYEKKRIKQIRHNNSPFVQTRSFQYDRRGYVISYIDSLFSDDEFLSRTVSTFSNNMLFSPDQITHRQEKPSGEIVYVYFETFTYDGRK